jgi:chromosome segregation ATPase
MYKNVDGEFTALTEPQSFIVKPLNNQTLLAKDKSEVLAFQKDVAELDRSLSGTKKLYSESKEKLEYIETAVVKYPAAPLSMMDDIKRLKDELYEVRLAIWGDNTRSSREMETLPGLSSRLGYVGYSSWWNTAEPTGTAREQFQIASEDYQQVLQKTRSIANDLAEMEKKLVELKVPYTPGRGSDWGEE